MRVLKYIPIQVTFCTSRKFFTIFIQAHIPDFISVQVIKRIFHTIHTIKWRCIIRIRFGLFPATPIVGIQPDTCSRFQVYRIVPFCTGIGPGSKLGYGSRISVTALIRPVVISSYPLRYTIPIGVFHTSILNHDLYTVQVIKRIGIFDVPAYLKQGMIPEILVQYPWRLFIKTNLLSRTGTQVIVVYQFHRRNIIGRSPRLIRDIINHKLTRTIRIRR